MKINDVKQRILITCAGGSGPQYLANSLKNEHAIFLTDVSDQNYGPYLGLPFFKVPPVDAPEYIFEIKNIIERENINVVVANSDGEVFILKKLCDELGNVICVSPNLSFIELCLNKKKLTQILHEKGISSLKTYKDNESMEFPVAVKPNRASGSRGFHVVKNSDELKGYFLLYNCTYSDVSIQPYIEGIEYTISVIVNNLNQIIGIVPKRIIQKRGITRAAVTESNDFINDACKKIVEELKPEGPINVQLKFFKNDVYIFEINPRLSTTVVLTDQAFGNEVQLFLQYLDRTEITGEPTLKEGVYLYRYEENFFIQ